MIFYKLKHIPTGLFFKPSKHRSKWNLSKDGKTYNKKPSAKMCGVEKSYNHPITEKSARVRYWENFQIRRCTPDDWEVVEFKVG